MARDADSFDRLVSTPSEKAALETLRRAAGGEATPMERHCLRVFRIIERLAEDRGLTIDREVALCASLLFDIGVFEGIATRDVYTRDGSRVARQVLEPFGWGDARRRLILAAIECHHRLASQWAQGAEVELLRRADLIDAFPAILRFGLAPAWLEDLFRRVPRDGLYRMLLSAVATMLRRRPATLPKIFLGPRSRL